MRKTWSLGPSGPKLKLIRACFVHLGRNSNSFRAPTIPETSSCFVPLERNSKSSQPVLRHGTETRTRSGPRWQDHMWSLHDVQGGQLMWLTYVRNRSRIFNEHRWVGCMPPSRTSADPKKTYKAAPESSWRCGRGNLAGRSARIFVSWTPAESSPRQPVF